MRRIVIAVLLVFILAVPISLGSSMFSVKNFGLDSLTNEQLLVLKNAIEQQLLLNNVDEADLMYKGRYDVGKVLEPGYYYFIGSGFDGYWDEIAVFESDKKYDVYDYIVNCQLREGEVASLFLEEGNCVGVSSGAVFCFKREHLPNWVK